MGEKKERGFVKEMKQHISKARIFVDRYTKDGGYVVSNDLDRYISKFQEEARPVIARAICPRLIEGITLGNYDRLIQGITSLKKYLDPDITGDLEETVRPICEEYKRKKEEKYRDLGRELERHLRCKLKEHGISGSAIEVNVEVSTQWNDILDRLNLKYDRPLSLIKDKFGGNNQWLRQG